MNKNKNDNWDTIVDGCPSPMELLTRYEGEGALNEVKHGKTLVQVLIERRVPVEDLTILIQFGLDVDVDCTDQQPLLDFILTRFTQGQTADDKLYMKHVFVEVSAQLCADGCKSLLYKAFKRKWTKQIRGAVGRVETEWFHLVEARMDQIRKSWY